ncbi:MAG: Arm DNA-binding domain-containing protein [Deltaproteobacteria bacterium]|nr:Arm DNA-binding domain-containing protein [Deltaproteobacteria bacterium]
MSAHARKEFICAVGNPDSQSESGLEPIMLFDGMRQGLYGMRQGLYLEVHPNGSKYWRVEDARHVFQRLF